MTHAVIFTSGTSGQKNGPGHAAPSIGLARMPQMQLQPRTAGRVQAAAPFLGSTARFVVARPQQCRRRMGSISCTAAPEAEQKTLQRPDKTGRYGRFGGKYVPETLISALAELEQAYDEARKDPEFKVGSRVMACCACGACQSLRHEGRVLCGLRLELRRIVSTMQAELDYLLKDYVGRASPLYHAERLSEYYRRWGK
jgi:hypothetical protein